MASRAANRDTIDLHGTSVSEAIVIVKDILQQEGSSPSTYFSSGLFLLPANSFFLLAKPLTIITGRGIHSVNGVGVLRPAVRIALEEDGWYIGAWDGGLFVKGKKGIY